MCENSAISQSAVRILLRIIRQWIPKKGTKNTTMGKMEHAFQGEKLKTKMQRFVWKEGVKTQRKTAQLKGNWTRDRTRDPKQILMSISCGLAVIIHNRSFCHFVQVIFRIRLTPILMFYTLPGIIFLKTLKGCNFNHRPFFGSLKLP